MELCVFNQDEPIIILKMAEKRNIVSKFLDKLDKKVEEKSKKKGCGCCCSSGECGKE